MTVLHVNSVDVQETRESWEICAAEIAAGEKRYLLLRRSRPTSGRLEHSTRGVYIECNQSENSVIGSIIQIDLHPKRIEIIFDKDTANALSVDSELHLDLDISDQQKRTLYGVLRRIAKDQCILVDDSARGLGLIKAIVFGPPTVTSERLVAPTLVGGILTICGAVAGYNANGLVGLLIGAAIGFAVLMLAILLLIGPFQRFRSKSGKAF